MTSAKQHIIFKFWINKKGTFKKKHLNRHIASTEVINAQKKLNPYFSGQNFSSKHFKCCLHSTTLEKLKATMQKMIGNTCIGVSPVIQHNWEQTTLQHNGRMGNSSQKQPHQNESLWRYTGETQQGRMLAPNFQYVKAVSISWNSNIQSLQGNSEICN